MKIKQYTITAPGVQEAMVATYIDGTLSALEGIHHMARMWEDVAINAPIPAKESEITQKQAHYQGLMLISPCTYDTPGQKISLFCRLYKHHRGSTYTVFPADSRAIELVPVTEELVNTYFTNTEWWSKQPKSIRNYCSNINELRQLIKPKEEPVVKRGKKYPDEWDRTYENTLRPTELQGYWQHLRSLGLAPVRENGTIVRWAKAITTAIILMVLLSSCLTPKRVQRYIQQHPNAVDLQYDSVYMHHIFHDTIYLPIDSFTDNWQWELGTPLLDTARIEFHNGRQSIFITRVRVDTFYKYRLRSVIAPDTIPVIDTFYLPCPAGTATVSVARAFPWWGWLIIIIASLLIIWLWKRK